MTSDIPTNPRIVLAGAVGSTHRILQGLLRHKMNIAGVFGLSEEASIGVSGYTRLDDLAQKNSLPYYEFRNINQPEIVEKIDSLHPDLLFAVGFSQLVKPELLAVPALGCVGFHPTKLPLGRGRAPIAWIILEGVPSAATFFLMSEQADSGSILAQEPYPVLPDDYASDVINSMEEAIDRALDQWLPELKQGVWNPVCQDESKATWYGKRTPDDGLIDWNQPAEKVYALIRAASHPHPGAYSYVDGTKVIIWRAKPELNCAFRGIPGRILQEDVKNGWLIQTGTGLLRLTDVEIVSEADQKTSGLKVGTQLGLTPENVLGILRKNLEKNGFELKPLLLKKKGKNS